MLLKQNFTCLGEILWITFFSLFLMEIGIYISEIIFHVSNNWGTLGKWIYNLLSDKSLSINYINSESFLSHPNIIGIGFHILLGFVFSLFYLILIHYVFKTSSKLLVGILFGITISTFTFFFELPSMGYGIMGIYMTHPVSDFLKIIIVHTFFGMGLGIGSIVFRRINQHLSV